MKKVAKPLLNIHVAETEPYCDYPTAVKIPMDDGTIQTYVLLNKTEYQFGKVMKCLNKMKVGYQYNYPVKRRCRTHKWKL